ncbi:rhodanese domain-containing protein [Sinorhizobium meliloti CCNWSX0020]|uniref:Rhodanese domain-containing protein n=1 Tax=Sinorhizobium meliloti CCNWSX0020 TaxID=1107881 RepID=H0FSU7_RHIML|nr:sulfurtransferase [Sinorhizobium meliloti]EHK80047.1 rhodanese domain-containing protein [Sinorhizobium meliloti CCNWSX0020]
MRIASLAFTLSVLASSALAAEISPLVDTAWVKANAGDENVVILDIRDKIAETELGDKPYIESAVVAPYASAGWRTEVGGIPGMLPPLEQITKLIGDLGIDNDDHVVIVPWGTDSTEFGGATRIYWTFKYLGHDEVSILDGGWRQYDAAGGARSAEAAKPVPATFKAEPQDELLATTEEVAAALKAGSTKLIDGRPVEQYEGKAKSPVVRANGTIPGSINIEHAKLYSQDHALFARPETVKALSEAVGLAADKENITFCNTGHWASVTWFALSEVLGNKNTSMYDGSMAEWAADPARPIENKSGT